MKCPIEGCNAEINGMTGLMELDNLNKHMNRKHRKKKSLNVFEAMVLRDHADEGVKLKDDFN